MMNSVLTMEERTLLQSLECESKVQALEVLEQIKLVVPVRSEMFRNAVTLSNKLRNEKIDYGYEVMRNTINESIVL